MSFYLKSEIPEHLLEYFEPVEIGQEATPALYVSALVEVFREVRRVLRDDGVVFLNLGDSYAGSWGAQGRTEETKEQSPISARQIEAHPHRASRTGSIPAGSGLKPGDLIGIPWAVAFALRDDGWWLRSDVVWSKRAPMPESVNGVRWERCRVKVAPSGRGGNGYDRMLANETASNVGDRGGAEWSDCPGCAKCEPNDGLILRRGAWRPTKAHEYVFMLAKSERYYADREAVLEPFVTDARENYPTRARVTGRGEQGFAEARGDDRDKSGGFQPSGTGRNKRSVWTIGPAPFDGQHYATMPPELAEICIRAGTSEKGACAECGAPWARVVSAITNPGGTDRSVRSAEQRLLATGGAISGGTAMSSLGTPGAQTKTTGWRPTCAHPGNPVPCVVLDPFGGALTTGLVALRLGRAAVLIDVSPDYIALGKERIIADAPLFNRVSA